MPAYAYKAHINRKRELIWKEHTKELDDCKLTVKRLEKIVGDSVFTVEYGRWNDCTIHWSTSREETDAEYKRRIDRLEKYNAEFDRRQQKKEA